MSPPEILQVRPETRRSQQRSADAVSDETLPEYAGELADFHEAFARDLQEVVHELPIHPQMKVLDAGCGDGFYTGLIAERLGEGGEVVGVDTNAACLELARHRIGESGRSGQVRMVEASIDNLPFPEGTFDFVWCAQSLYSLPDPKRALTMMRRVVRPGGVIGILENDSLHQIMLPWPERLELALRTAQYAAWSRESNVGRFYIGRRLPELIADAGLQLNGYRTQAIDRCGVPEPPLERFVKAYLRRLSETVEALLPAELLEQFRRLIAPDSDEYLLRQPQFTMTWLNVLALARREPSE